jgi:hypothetical protein
VQRWKLLGALAAAVSAAVGLWLRSPGNRITPENFDRLRAGMTRADVEALLGPPGAYVTGPGVIDGTGYRHEYFVPPQPRMGTPAVWDCDDARIVVDFDDAGRATMKTFLSTKRIDQPPLDNLLCRLRLLWERWFPDRTPPPQPPVIEPPKVTRE